jgi:hypothetical protein
MLHTFGDAVARYLIEVLPNKRPNTQRGQHTQLLWWKARLGSYAHRSYYASIDHRGARALEAGTRPPRQAENRRYRKPLSGCSLPFFHRGVPRMALARTKSHGAGEEAQGGQGARTIPL